MFTKSKMATNALLEEMKELAIEQQQRLYELLSAQHCTTYNYNEHEHLKRNIGYAIYGPPKSQEVASTPADSGNCYSTKTQKENAHIIDITGYDKKADNVIKRIYNQICKYTTKIDSTQPIYFGTIYNVIFCPKVYMREKKKREKSKKAGKKTEAEKKEGEETMRQVPMVCPIAVFKIWKINRNKKNSAKRKDGIKSIKTEIEYELWYIDTNARIYKSWADYKTNNNLPKCIMVLPKDGCYQSNPDYPITEKYSTVWLEIVDSPACAWTAKACKIIDITSNILGVGMLGLGIASMLTPVGPILTVIGLATTGVTNSWQMGRCIHHLVDRNKHKESIHLLHRDAFPQWLGVANSVFGLGSIGGTVAISEAVASGITVSSAAEVVYNSVQGGDLLFSSVEVIYQSYDMIDTCRNVSTEMCRSNSPKISSRMVESSTNTEILCTTDVYNTIVDSTIAQRTAADMYIYESPKSQEIASTPADSSNCYNTEIQKENAHVINIIDYNEEADYDTCGMSENAEIISYISDRNDLLSSVMPPSTSNRMPLNSQNTRTSSFENGQLEVKDIALLDPMKHVIHHIKSGILVGSSQNNPSNSPEYTLSDFNFKLLMEVLSNLTTFYMSSGCPSNQNLPTTLDIEPLCREMSSTNIDENIRCELFTIALKLRQSSQHSKGLLLEAFRSVRCYYKKKRQRGIYSCCLL